MAEPAGVISIRNLHYGEIIEGYDGGVPQDEGHILFRVRHIAHEDQNRDVVLVFSPAEGRKLGRQLLGAAWDGLRAEARNRRALRKLANERRRNGDIHDIPEGK